MNLECTWWLSFWQMECWLCQWFLVSLSSWWRAWNLWDLSIALNSMRWLRDKILIESLEQVHWCSKPRMHVSDCTFHIERILEPTHQIRMNKAYFWRVLETYNMEFQCKCLQNPLCCLILLQYQNLQAEFIHSSEKCFEFSNLNAIFISCANKAKLTAFKQATP